MATFRYVVADVFTDRPLEGNQLAVFTDARDLPEDLLQPLARELKFSETVFVYPAENDGHARMRIFTPAAEVPFAGHPTLGTAFVLGGPLQLGEIRLETRAGIVPVELEREGARITFGRKRPPSRDRYRRFRAAKSTTSGSSSATATARPAGRPRPDSRHVSPASCETR